MAPNSWPAPRTTYQLGLCIVAAAGTAASLAIPPLPDQAFEPTPIRRPKSDLLGGWPAGHLRDSLSCTSAAFQPLLNPGQLPNPARQGARGRAVGKGLTIAPHGISEDAQSKGEG